MTIFRNLFFVCIVMALSSLGVTLPAHSKTYLDFYEVTTDGEAPFKNCRSGEISNKIKEIEKSLNDQYSGSTFGIVCLPKWYIVDDPSKNIVVLVPYSLGDEIDRLSVRYQMNDLLFKLPKCSNDLQTCIEPAAFERTAYEYNDVNVFPNFTQDAYDYDGFLNTLTSPEIDGVMRTQVVKLIQANLTPEKYDPNWVDGAVGPGTRKVLKQFFDGLKTQYPDAVPRDVLFTNLFPNLVQLMPVQKLPSPLVVNNVETKVDQSGESEITQIELEVLNLRKLLEEQKELYASLKESHEKEISSLKAKNLVLLSTVEGLSRENASQVARLEQKLDLYKSLLEANEQEISSLKGLRNESISQKWNARVSQNSFNTTGKLPDGKSVALTVLERSFSERDCTLSIDQPLETQFAKHVEQNKCFVISFEKYDEDTNSIRAYDEDSNTLTIPVLEKQSDLILSISSESLDDFDEVDTNSCWVGLKLLDEANRDIGTTIELWMQVVDVDGRIKAKLTDFDTIAAKELSWRDRKLQLVDVTPEGQTSSCMVTNTKAFDVIDRTTDPNNFAPIALIDRSGNVVLKNLPLMRKRASELHVFLDTLVGPEGDENYGFNDSIYNIEDRVTQEIFFEGFLKGIQTFLLNRTDIGKVTIYQTVMHGKNRELQELQTFTRANTAGDYDLITDDFISNYISEFNAGVSGEFDNKKRKLARLLKSNRNSLFISFGSSGLTDDKVCQRKIERLDYTENSVIFDVVPSFTVRQLIEADELETVSRGFAYKCSIQDRIVPLRPLNSMAMKEVSYVVETVLDGWRY